MKQSVDKQQLLQSCGRLQFISHFTERYSYLDAIRMALEGGCRWIQLRVKGATDEEVRPMAIQAQTLCHHYGAVFIIDDRVELVQAIKADGVHLGKNDMPVDQARQLLGEEFIIGGTANTLEDICALVGQGVDYIGCGPFRFTTTKEKLSPILGLEGYKDIIQKMKEESIDIPLVAIGGITKEDIPEIMKTGVNGIALSGCILHAVNPVEETREILALL